MLRISNKDNQPENVQAAYVYHPQSAALEKRVAEIIASQLALFGMDSNDYHEIRNDLSFVREMRYARKRGMAIAGKAILLALLTVLGSLLSAGFYTLINRSEP